MPGEKQSHFKQFKNPCLEKKQHVVILIKLIRPSFPQDNRVHIGPKMEIRVVTLGLDGAGKTTILFKLKQDEFMQPIPTIGIYMKPQCMIQNPNMPFCLVNQRFSFCFRF